MTVDVHLITTQVPVYNGRILAVQVLQAREQLPGPLLHSLQLQMLMALPVLSQVARGEELSDQVDAVVILILPSPVAPYDVLVFQPQASGHLSDNIVHLGIIQVQSGLQDFAPGNVYPSSLVEALVNVLEAPCSHLCLVSVHHRYTQKKDAKAQLLRQLPEGSHTEGEVPPMTHLQYR